MNKLPSIFVCVLLDIIGSITYIIPFVGEWGDVMWAPLSAFLYLRMFGGKNGKIGSVVSLIEELLPFTDFIPTFTLGYIVRRYFENKS